MKRLERSGILGLAVCLVISGLLNFSAKANAATFNPNRIIDDAVFDNTGTMSADQINTFLNQFPKSCISPSSGFQARVPSGYTPSGGYTYGNYASAGDVVWAVSVVFGVNPQVLLTTLEKEQSLVTGRNSTTYCAPADDNNHKYAAAMGYGCPDSTTKYSYSGLELYHRNGITYTDVGPTCVNAASKAGFSQQLVRAAWLLKFGEQRSEGNIGWNVQLNNVPYTGNHWDNSDDPQSCYGGPMTQGNRQVCPGGTNTYYDGNRTIDATVVHIDNGATAALYWYTPHFHGNQMFNDTFTQWFGSTAASFGNRPAWSTSYANAPCRIPNYDGSYVGRLYQPDNQDYLFTTSTVEACSALKIGYIWDGIVMKNAGLISSTIPVYRGSNLFRHFFTADPAVRADYLNNRGYHDEGVVFYAYSSQQPNTIPAYSLTNGVSSLFTSAGAEGSLFVQSYGYQSPGIAFYTPDLNSVAQKVTRLKKVNERFYSIDPAEVTSSLQQNYVSEGSVSTDDVMPDQNNLPVYRLVGPNSHFFTTNRAERDLAIINLNYFGEGVAFYTPAASFPNAQTVFRQTNYIKGLPLYTSNLAEHNDSRTFYGYVDEGAGWYGY